MAAVLNTNAASLYASKNLQSAQSYMAQSVERLSSGLRINRSRDDSAGMSISNSLTSQINGANQGIRNLNDGISMVQTAEGAIAAAQDMGQRILTLATQGANGTMGVNERTSIRNEMLQLLSAIDAIGGRTKFSGNSLLNNDARTSAANKAAPTGDKFKLQATNQSNDSITLAANAFLNIGGFSGTSSSSVSAATGQTFTLSAAPPSTVVGSTIYKVTNNSGADSTYAAIGTVASVSGTTVTIAGTAAAFDGSATAVNLVFGGLLTQELSSTAGDKSLSVAVNSTDLYSSTASTFLSAFQNVQRAASGYLDALSSQRSLLGAYQNQIEYTVNNVTELSSNLASARSNVQDTDYATETASLTKGQILQQAATAMLAQANQMPNVILSLLK